MKSLKIVLSLIKYKNTSYEIYGFTIASSNNNRNANDIRWIKQKTMYLMTTFIDIIVY